MAYKNKKRITVGLDEDTLKKVEQLSNLMNVSIAKVCENLIESQIDLSIQSWLFIKNKNTQNQLIDTFKTIPGCEYIVNSLVEIQTELDNNPKIASSIDEFANPNGIKIKK